MLRRPPGGGEEGAAGAEESAVLTPEIAIVDALEHGREPLEHQFGQIGVGQVPRRAAEGGQEAQAPGERRAGDAEQAPRAAKGERKIPTFRLRTRG